MCMKVGWVTNDLLTDRFDCEFYDYETVNIVSKLRKLPHRKLKDFVVNKKSEPPIHSSMYSTKERGVPIIRFANFTDFEYDISNNVIYLDKVYLDQPSIKEFILKPETLVYGLVGDVGHAFIPGKNVPLSVTYRRVAQLDLEGIDVYFLCTFINTKYGKKQFDRFTTGVNQRQLRLEDSIEIIVPYPSKEIQTYIGNKVRKAEELREEAKRLKEEAEKLLTQFLKLDSLEQKINKVLHLKANYVLPHDMNDRLDSEHYKKKFTILYEHLKELEQSKVKVLSLKKIIEEGSYGILPDSQDYGKGELIFIRSTDLNGYMIDLDSCETVPDKYLTPKATVSPGDILLEIKGAIAGGAIVPDIKTNAIVNGSIFRFRVKNDFNNFYILSVLQSIIGSLQKEQHGANSVISYLSLDVINNLKIPVIDIEKQNEIGDKLKKFVENNMKAKNLIKSAKQDVEDLIEGKFDESKISEGV